MAFNGSAPEITNARLAMLGFAAALGAELASGESVFQQLLSRSAEPWILYTFVLFIGASIIPIAKVSRPFPYLDGRLGQCTQAGWPCGV